MRSSTCSAYKHLTFIPYALATVVEELGSVCGISILGPGFHTGSFTVAFGHGHPLVYIDYQLLHIGEPSHTCHGGNRHLAISLGKVG
jgi:hypothetical protein